MVEVSPTKINPASNDSGLIRADVNELLIFENKIDARANLSRSRWLNREFNSAVFAMRTQRESVTEGDVR